MRLSIILLSLTAALALAACGSAPDQQAAESPPASTSMADNGAAGARPEADATPANSAARPLQAQDVDAYARGMQSEVAWLQAAREKFRQARAEKNDEAMLEALAQATSSDLDAAAAKAAGLDVARYGRIRNTIDGVIMAIALQSAPGAPPSLQMDAYRDVPEDVADALKARLPEIQELHAQAMGLRMKLAEG